MLENAVIKRSEQSTIMNTHTVKLFLGSRFFMLAFHVITSFKGSKLFVVATDQSKRKYPFNMEKKGDEWRVVHGPKPHEIIIKHEREISLAIRKSLDTKSRG